MENDKLSEDLLFAICEGKVEDVERLMKSANFSKKRIQDCFYAAVFYNQTDIAKVFFKRHLKCMSKDKMSPALYLATRQANLEIVEMLLENGVDIDKFLVPFLLELAVKVANDKVIEQILKSGISVHSKVRGSFSSIHIAIEEGSLQTIECLLTNGADANSTYDDQRHNCTLLHHAVETGEEAVVQLLLKHGAKVDVKASDDSTPICVAVEKGFEQIARLLIQAGADVNFTCKKSVKNGHSGREVNEGSTTDEKCSLLHTAIEEGYEGIVELLLENNAKITSDSSGRTPSQVAAGKGNEKILKLLHDHDTDTTAKTSVNGSSLHEFSAQGCLEKVETMLKCGADVNFKNDNGRTPLFLAAKKGHEHMVRLLLKHGADINYKNGKGWTPLHYFSTEGLEISVECLLKCDASVNSGDFKGRTSLHFAAQRGHVGTVRLLLKYDAEIDITDKDGDTPLTISAVKGKTEVVAVLLQAGANVGSENVERTLFDLLEKSRDKEVKLLLKHKAKFSSSTEGDTGKLDVLLFDQIGRGNAEIVEALLKAGAHANSSSNPGDRTPLVQAAICGQDRIVKLLLDSGAEPDHGCKTALLWAVTTSTPDNKNLNTIKILLEYGAQVDHGVCCGEYTNPLCAAADKFWLPEILQLLLEYGSVDAAIVPEISMHNLFHTVNQRGLVAYQNHSNIPPHGVNAAEILVKHIIKMKAANLYFRSDNFKAMTYCNEAVIRKFQTQCEKEIAAMVTKKVGGMSLSFHSILTNHPYLLVQFVEDDIVVQTIRSGDFKKEFPIYANNIAYQFEKGMIRRRLLEEGRKNYESLFNQFPLLTPVVPVEAVLGKMSNYDLKCMSVMRFSPDSSKNASNNTDNKKKKKKTAC